MKIGNGNILKFVYKGFSKGNGGRRGRIRFDCVGN